MLNWPNLLTAVRVLLAPFMVMFLVRATHSHYTAALMLFLVAAATDMIDGFLARRLRRVTDFGKFMDPLADKVIVVSALVSFLYMRLVPLWMVLAVVGRDLVITGFRSAAAARGTFVYASSLAKFKTALLMFAIGMIMFHLAVPGWFGDAWSPRLDMVLEWIVKITLWVAVLLTLATGFWYFVKNRQVVASIFIK